MSSFLASTGFLAEGMWKTVVADYKHFDPRGWACRARRTLEVLGLRQVVLALGAMFRSSST